MISDEKLFKIAIAYYKNGETQQSIAKEFGVSHVQVGKYLKLAKDRGIVEIRINAPFISNDEKGRYELYLRERFGLEKLVLVPSASNEKQSFRFLVEGTAEYLLKKYTNKPLNIALGMGKTINGISSFKPRTADKRSLWNVCPVTNYSVGLGDGNSEGSYFSYHNLMKDFSCNWGSKIDRKFMEALSLSNGDLISDYWEKVDVLVGGVGIPISRDPEARHALLGKEEAKKYALSDIQGDYLNYFFDEEGHIVKSATLSPLAITESQMKKIPERIAVASGFSKVLSIIGLLRCGIVNTLITDIETASNIVGILK